MKRMMLMAAAIALILCACGKQSVGSSTTPAAVSGGYTVIYNGVKLSVGMPAEEALGKLGAADDKITSESCAFGGSDTVYYYGTGVQVSTNDELGYERIFSIYLSDDLVSTEEGVCIGNTVEQVKAAYGEPGSKSTGNSLAYEKDGMTLTFFVKDGTVTSIRYDA